MDIRAQAVRSFRLRAHHLDKMLPSGQIETAAGACGVQNSPPGAWETALFNRVEGCTLPELHDALMRLPEEVRTPIVLHYMEGYPVGEIASALRLAQGTVKSRMRRGRAMLKKLLSEEELS